MESINVILSKTRASKSNSNFNKLVPKLIEQSNKLTKELKYRIKLNSFFSEFESKASNQFNFFIKESRARYRGSRSGCNLDSLIASSRKKCLKEAKKIINDNFYNNNKDILIEKEKMKRKTTNKIYKNFRETLYQLKNINKSNSNNNSFSNLLNENKKNPKNKKNIKKSINRENSSEKLSKGKNDIKSLLNKEELLIYKTMDKYKDELKSLNTLSEDQKYPYIHKNMFFNLPKLNLLTYKKYVPPIRNPDEEENANRVDFKKLLPYSRLGKNLGYTYNNFNQKKKNIAFITEPQFGFSTNYGDYMKNIRNTNEIVFNSANKEFNIESRINKKRQIIENMLGVDDVPKLDSYEIIIKNIFNKRKKERELKLQSDKFFDAKKEDETNLYNKANQNILKGFRSLNNIERKLYSHTQESFNNK